MTACGSRCWDWCVPKGQGAIIGKSLLFQMRTFLSPAFCCNVNAILTRVISQTKVPAPSCCHHHTLPTLPCSMAWGCPSRSWPRQRDRTHESVKTYFWQKRNAQWLLGERTRRENISDLIMPIALWIVTHLSSFVLASLSWKIQEISDGAESWT